MKQLILNLNTLAKQLGFGKGLLSYDKMYKTSINTFAHKQASMWFFTISLNTKNEIVGIEINSNYFNHTPQTNIINSHASFENPISFETAFKLIGNLSK